METVLLKPLRSEVHYQGLYEKPAFHLLTSPTLLYENLLKHLGKYGADLNSLAFDANVLANANVACTILDLGSITRVRLDRLEVSFMRFHQVGEPTAREMFLASWAALQETAGAPKIKEHLLNVHLVAEIQNGLYHDAVRKFVNTPAALGKEVNNAAVAFYLQSNQSKGERNGSIVIDRVMGQEKAVDFRLTIGLDANSIPVEKVSGRFDNFMNKQVENLGFQLLVEKVS